MKKMDNGGKNPILVCRFCFDKKFEIPCSGGRKNQKQKVDQQEHTKRKSLDMWQLGKASFEHDLTDGNGFTDYDNLRKCGGGGVTNTLPVINGKNCKVFAMGINDYMNSHVMYNLIMNQFM